MPANLRNYIEYLDPEPGKWLDLLDGLRVLTGQEYIFAATREPRNTACSGVIGGGLGPRKFFINRQVGKDYCADLPAEEMAAFLGVHFKEYRTGNFHDWAGLMTAARVNDACWVKISRQDYSVVVIVTAGVNNACAAGVTPCCILSPAAGTINIMAFMSHVLSPGAMINAVQTVTEAKTQTLRELNVICPATGAFASGTTTDALILSSAGSGPHCPYAGPGTIMGYLLALGVREALPQSLKYYWSHTGENI